MALNFIIKTVKNVFENEMALKVWNLTRANQTSGGSGLKVYINCI